MRTLAPILATVVAVLPVRVHAQALPDLGGSSGGPLPVQIERRIGEGIMRDIRARDPSYVDDPEISDYLNVLGGRLVSVAAGARSDFEFFAVRDPSINAFALPGGFVGINTGLLQSAETESELASVLAHEITHVTQRHISRLLGAQEQIQQLQLPAMIALVAAGVLAGRGDLVMGAAAAVQAGGIQAQINYTRDFEREADRIGLQTLVASGFDPRAMPVFFEKMQRSTRLMDDGTVPRYLRTHPISTERIAEAQDRVQNLAYRQQPDSLEFHLVRAKLRADSGYPEDAVEHFSAAMRDHRYASETAARYGLVIALLRAGFSDRAAQAMRSLRAMPETSTMFDTLDARVRAAGGDMAGALTVLRGALSRSPHNKPIAYAYATALLDARQVEEASSFLLERRRLYPQDERFLALQSRTYAAMGKRLLQHQTQAEIYVLRGSLPAAIEQLQLARAAGDGDFYQVAIIDARLRELRTRHAEEARATGKR